MTHPTRVGGAVPLVPLDAGADAPLFEQLYAGVRERILDGDLRPGTRVASTRVLAAELGISRFTVVTAFDQLRAEGYVVTARGGGTFVARELPERHMRVSRDGRGKRAGDGGPAAAPRPAAPPALSRRGETIGSVIITGPRGDSGEPRPFRPRRPPLDTFPFSVWARLVRREWRTFRHPLLDYGEPAGLRTLREAIAAHLAATRGVRCDWRQVIVTSGAQQAVDVLFRVLLDPGEAAWIEEPGNLDVRGALLAAGARLVPVPVDREGIDVEAGRRLAPRARLAYVSPSHQYPTGATLSAARRLALLAWAEEARAWIVEDDYDSHFRYRGRPLPALQRLDAERHASGSARVAYVGTFSKTMFPALRLGYCVVPEAIVEVVTNARAVADRGSPAADQGALAAFIADGHYDRHLRRARATCVERHEAMRHHAARLLGGVLSLAPANAGTHVIASLVGGRRRREGRGVSEAVRVSQAAAEAGLVVLPLSRYHLVAPAEDALVLGYGGLSPARIVSGLERLARVIDLVRRRASA